MFLEISNNFGRLLAIALSATFIIGIKGKNNNVRIILNKLKIGFNINSKEEIANAAILAKPNNFPNPLIGNSPPLEVFPPAPLPNPTFFPDSALSNSFVSGINLTFMSA